MSRERAPDDLRLMHDNGEDAGPVPPLNRRPLEEQLAQALCEWDQPKDSCRCRNLPASDGARCQSPIGIAWALMKQFDIEPK